MQTARRKLKSEMIDGKIYVFGGRQYGGAALSITEMCDSETNTSLRKADMIIGRFYSVSSVANGNIYAQLK